MAKEMALRFEDDFSNGAETVEIVFGIVFAVGLGAALVTFQGTIFDAFTYAQNEISDNFMEMEGR